jgi:signal transduction histidine kinase
VPAARLADPSKLLWMAAAGTWLAVGIPAAARLGDPAQRPLAAVAFAAWLVFGVAFVGMQCYVYVRTAYRRSLALLALQSACAVVVAWSGQTGIEVALLVMTASGTLAVLPWRGAVLWIVLQTAACLAPQVGHVPVRWLLVRAGVTLGFQGFALGAIQLAFRESQARAELATVNEDLRAAHVLLAQNARLAERLRIARDLHDSLGHHLTALGLSLEVASHVADERSAPHVKAARDLTKLLLAEVRDVVSELREESAPDLEPALRGLVQAVSRPRIHLQLPDGLSVREPERAHTVVRCVQEIVTNTLRHAAAENLWIDIAREGDGLSIRAHDDGRGAAGWRPGHGLEGMRERLERAGGRLDVTTEPGRGFALSAFVPLPAAPA